MKNIFNINFEFNKITIKEYIERYKKGYVHRSYNQNFHIVLMIHLIHLILYYNIFIQYIFKEFRQEHLYKYC